MSNIEIQYILDGAIPNRERVMFKVNYNDNAGFYIALLTTEITYNTVSIIPKTVFWFPNQQVQTGDYIFLYTGLGINTKFTNKLGTTSYNFYWNSKLTLFNNQKDSIVLMKADSWNYKKKG